MFLVNQHDIMFEVKCEFDASKLTNATIFKNVNDMYDHIIDKFEMDLEEIEHFEFIIDYDKDDNDYSIETDGGIYFATENNIEEFVNNYEL